MLSLIAAFLFATQSWSADLPFEKYFGIYDIKSCEKLDSKVAYKTFCELKKVSIRQSPEENGQPATHLDFTPEVAYNHGRSDGSAVKFYESLSQWKGLKNVKFEQNKDGDHYFDSIENQTTKRYQIRDVWMKVGSEGKIILKVKKRTSTSSDDKGMISEELNHELTLAPAR